MRTLSRLLCILAFASWPWQSSWATSFTAEYDAVIQDAVQRYWPDYPFWRAWKAQLYQESRLQPAARSHVGASGIAQFMPRTWEEVQQDVRWLRGHAPTEPTYAIYAGAYYMVKIKLNWDASYLREERHRFAQAAYNAGAWNIRKAQLACGGTVTWAATTRCLPQITGRHAQETITYVERIARWRALLDSVQQ